MQTLLDFLSFKRFIAADVLICCYYIGAVLIPLALFGARSYLVRKISWLRSFEEMLTKQAETLEPKSKRYLILFFILMFLAMELMWRMMLEMMIGYFQMHDYLQQMATGA